MPRSLPGRFLVLLLALALATAACSSRDETTTGSGGRDGGGDTSQEGGAEIDTENCAVDPTTEVEGDTIKLVSSFPQSGLTAAFSEIAKGWKAFFEYTNEEQGGVEINGKKYKIETEDKDDEYNAQKTSSNIEELVGTSGDKAFAVFSVVGTANNINIRDFLGENCVPNLLTATGSPAWGNPEYPWTIGSTLAPYTLEGHAFAEYLEAEEPDVKTVAMLVQNDDFGAAYEEGFKDAIEGTDIKVVKVEKYATGANEVGAQLTSLAATKADAFFNGGTLLACPDALKKAQAANWKPVIWVSGTCISKTLTGIAGDAADGVISMTNVKDPLNPIYDDDEAMKLYREKVKQYQPDADIDNGIVAYGWTQAAILVKALENAEKATRLDVMNSVRNLDGVEGGLLIPGAKVTTSGTEDPYMGETVQRVQYNFAEKHFENIGEPVDFEGKTAKLTPKGLISG